MGFIRQTGIGADKGVAPIGYIKIGEKQKFQTKDGREYERPVSLDYFKAVSSNPEYVELFSSAYGNAPKNIEITFTGDDNDIDEVFTCRSDKGSEIKTTRNPDELAMFAQFLENGQQFTVYAGTKYGVLQAGQFYKQVENGWEPIPTPTPDQLKTYPPPVVWKHEIVINFRIPRTSRIDGLWQFRTGGVSTYASLKVMYLKAKQDYGQYFSDCVFDMNIRISKGSKNDRRFPVVTFACNFGKVKELEQYTFRRLANPSQLALPTANPLQLSTPEPQILETEIEDSDYDYTDELNTALTNY